MGSIMPRLALPSQIGAVTCPAEQQFRLGLEQSRRDQKKKDSQCANLDVNEAKPLEPKRNVHCDSIELQLHLRFPLQLPKKRDKKASNGIRTMIVIYGT